MPKEFLHRSDIRTPPEQESGKAVAQQMRRNPFLETCFLSVRLYLMDPVTVIKK